MIYKHGGYSLPNNWFLIQNVNNSMHRGCRKQVETVAKIIMSSEKNIDLRLQDPLDKITRRVRRNLLVCSATLILVAKTGMVPKSVQGLGVVFSNSQQCILLYCFIILTTYLLLSFFIYSVSDFYRRQVNRKEQLKESLANIIKDSLENHSGDEQKDKAYIEIKNFIDKTASKIHYNNKLVNFSIKIRIVWDYVIPLVVSFYAIISILQFTLSQKNC